MSPYIETIRLQEGELRNLAYHQKRFQWTRKQELGLSNHPELREVIQLPEGLEKGIYKCRIIYGKEIQWIEFEPYARQNIRSLKLVYSDSISYGHKYSERSELEALFHQRGACDDILIVQNGCITDSYFANAVFWNGEGWFTPDTPLLPGTMRAYLLDCGKIETARITQQDLGLYRGVRLINAMNDLEDGDEIPMERVSYQ